MFIGAGTVQMVATTVREDTPLGSNFEHRISCPQDLTESVTFGLLNWKWYKSRLLPG